MNFNFSRAATAALTITVASISNVATAGIIAPAEAGYTQVYGLDIDNSNYHNNVPYYLDNAGAIADGSFERIAYHLELQKQGGDIEWVWVSMDAFTNNASLTGVPSFAGSNTSFQQKLNNMNVFSNKAGITTGLGITTGNIEFWPYNYAPANIAGLPNGDSNVYDFADQSINLYNYGSMQIHNYGAEETLFALNRFYDVTNKDLGIGNQATSQTDWTFASNSNDYIVKTLDIYVGNSEIPEPSTLAVFALGLLGLASRRFKTRA
ncbi:MAG: PEP-CTERM sorting domain-containing protein [Pseudomonadales bacterium]|nr:PEP-CTERM sorting domain-containing protein [Pseudomonadales bacterium]